MSPALARLPRARYRLTVTELANGGATVVMDATRTGFTLPLATWPMATYAANTASAGHPTCWSTWPDSSPTTHAAAITQPGNQLRLPVLKVCIRSSELFVGVFGPGASSAAVRRRPPRSARVAVIVAIGRTTSWSSGSRGAPPDR
jgi:hypothetical protein